MIRFGVVATCLSMLFVGASASAACKVGKIAELAVTMSDMSPLVTVQINGTPVKLIADSGAYHSFISEGGAAQLHLRTRPLPSYFTFESVGGTVDASVTKVKDFTLADTPLHNVDFVVGGGEQGGDVLGLLGQNVLALGDVEYDLADGAIRLFRPEGCERLALAYWSARKPYSVIQIEPSDGLNRRTIATVYVNGVRLRATFDTGAAASFLTVSAAAKAGVRIDSPGVSAADAVASLGRQQVRSWIAPISSFKIGDEEIRNTRLRIGDFPRSSVDMIIGADFFLSHRVYVANSQDKLYLTYNGGRVFNLARSPEPASASSAPASANSTPSDADGFARRGAASAARRQLDAAIADFTRAIALAPTEPRYLTQRALAHAEAKQPFLAMADLDAALKLKPDDVQTLLARARFRLAGHEPDEAKADLDAADKVAPKEADSRLTLAQLYGAADLFEPAIANFDLWLAVHTVDSRRAEALNGRCWTRAQAGRELDRALADCNASLSLAPHEAGVLDSRGLVRLRRGDFDRAIADYDAALALRPKSAWSLYGRGVAKLKKGRKDEGDADLAAAAALAPTLAERASKLGVSP